jgi:hypothetical protein
MNKQTAAKRTCSGYQYTPSQEREEEDPSAEASNVSSTGRIPGQR